MSLLDIKKDFTDKSVKSGIDHQTLFFINLKQSDIIYFNYIYIEIYF